MHKVVVVDSFGIPLFTSSYQTDEDAQEAVQANHPNAFIVEPGTDDNEIMSSWVRSGGSWSTRPKAPSEYHVWSDGSWVWDEQRAKGIAKREIDQMAENVRMKYVTPGSGQAMEHEAAHREAEQYLEGKPGAYPMLQADIAAGLAADLDGAAQMVMQMRSQWELLGAAVRRIRLQSKRQIDQMSSQAEVEQVRDQAIAQLGAL